MSQPPPCPPSTCTSHNAHGVHEETTDPILLAELMAIRTLILNLFAAASKGPLTDESLRKMLAYADSIKQQKADEFLAARRSRSSSNRSRNREKETP